MNAQWGGYHIATGPQLYRLLSSCDQSCDLVLRAAQAREFSFATREPAIDETGVESNIETTTPFPNLNEPARQAHDERRPAIEAVSD